MDLDVNVEFGGVSIGETTARLGVKLQRGQMELDQADAVFSGKRLQGLVTLQSRDDEGQTRLPGMEDNVPPTLETVFDVKQFTVKPKWISAGLTFALESIDVSQLALFAKRTGILRAEVVGDLEEDDEDDEDHDDRDPGPARSTKSRATNRVQAAAKPVEGDEGAGKPIAELVKFGLTKKKCEIIAKACGGPTIGDFEAWMQRSEWWHKDLPGFGEEWITKLQDAHLAFRQKYRIPTEDEVAELRAYREGCEAAIEDKPLDANPYAGDDDPLRSKWAEGWEATNAPGDEEETGTIFEQAGAEA